MLTFKEKLLASILGCVLAWLAFVGVMAYGQETVTTALIRRSQVVSINAGVPVRLSATSRIVKSILIEYPSTVNSAPQGGDVYIGNNPAMNRPTLAGVEAKLIVGGSYSLNVFDSPVGLDLSTYYIDGDLTGSKVIVSYVMAP